MKNRFFLSRLFIAAIVSLLSTSNYLVAQESTNNAGQIHGNMQMDAQYYNADSAIGAAAVPEKMLMNGFCNLIYTNKNFSAGLRYESYLNPMQGYDPRYKGNGIPYRYATYTVDELEVTAGNFYEQFGSGMVLRAYEERGLGIDNVFDGIRLKYNLKGIYMKGLIGKQRNYFTQGPGIVRGFDGEVQLNELITKWNEASTRIMLGGSFVSKFQSGSKLVYQTSTLEVPENVGAGAGRMKLSGKKFNISGEYVYKINDPDAINGYLYRPGEAILIQANYFRKGFGLALGAKRWDNMSFKSDRTANGADLLINFLPALNRQHTYALMAFYPYATQPKGEIGYNAELNYKLKKETALGGKYGTDIALNYSVNYGLDTTAIPSAEDSSRQGYTVSYFGMDELYYQDINIEVSRKLSKKTKLRLLYANQVYNKNIVQGLSGYKVIYSNIAMAELTIRLDKGRSIRTELQHLATKQDQQDWAMGLIEVGLGEHWIVSILDLYNYGNDKPKDRLHYYNGNIIYIKGATRIAMGYGKQRAGIFCVGGVCRYVPASNGLTLAVTTSF